MAFFTEIEKIIPTTLYGTTEDLKWPVLFLRKNNKAGDITHFLILNYIKKL